MIRSLIMFVVLMGAILMLGLLLNHTYQPSGTIADVPQWPLDTSIEAHDSSPLLIAFAHPHCPCFRATLFELTNIARQFSDLRIYVVFSIPDGAAEGWHLGGNWDNARASFVAIADQRCVETERFHATASGQLMLFKNARCLFHGGITAGRGHTGPCAGNVELRRVLNNCTPSAISYPVFGCPLFDEGA